MTERVAIIGGNVTDGRRKLAESAAESFEMFCDGLQIPMSESARPLYLTSLVDAGIDARRLRREISSLDLAAQITGNPLWSDQPEVSRWVRGIGRELPVGTSAPRADPLYRELVVVLQESLSWPNLEQLVAVAAICLTNATQLSVPMLSRLRWQEVRLRFDEVQVRPRALPVRGPRTPEPILIRQTAGRGCPVTALKKLKRHEHALGAFVFGGQGNSNDEARLRAALRHLPAPPPGGLPRPKIGKRALDRVVRIVERPDIQRTRDRAVIALAYGASLRTREAIELRQKDVTVHPRGLLLSIPGRRSMTTVEREPDPRVCPVAAWTQWQAAMRSQGLTGSTHRAILQVSGSVIWDKAIGPSGLNYLIHQRCDETSLQGNFTFTSLRTGAIRTAIRDSQAAHSIASHAGLRSLGSVARHEEREQLLRQSVAGMVGL